MIECVRIILTAQFNIFIAYLFCSKTDQHINTLGTQAMMDDLSGLANRRSFTKTLKQLGDTALAKETSNYLLLLDIDNIKQINDTHGHIAGDDTIKHFAQILKNIFSENKNIFRLGGDEFAIIVSSTSAPFVRVLAEKVRQKIKDKPLPLSTTELKYTASIGIAESTNNDREWYINADNALTAIHRIATEHSDLCLAL